MTENPAFTGGTSDDFEAHAETVRGYIRYTLVQERLTVAVRTIVTETEKPELSILDVGGGSARDAVHLARLRHRVLVADISEEQLAKGRQRVEREPSEVRQKVSFLHGSVYDVAVPPQRFDVTMSHGVMMYLPEPEEYSAFADQLCLKTRSGGIVSLLEKGYPGAYSRLVRQGRTAEAEELRNTSLFTNNMGKTARAFMPEELHRILLERGAFGQDAISWGGVRIVYDHDERPVTAVADAELSRIIEDERQLGWSEHSRGMGQMLHFIGKITI